MRANSKELTQKEGRGMKKRRIQMKDKKSGREEEK